MKSKNILIVEDNDLNRKLFESLVGQLWEYQSATNGLEALKKVKENHFDLILMDIQMPHLDGISTLKQIRANAYTDCPVIAVTAYADESDRLAFLNEGFDEFITKPIRPREFMEKIQFLIELNKGQISQTRKEKKQNIKPLILDPEVVEQLGKYNKAALIQQVYLDFLKEADELMSRINENFRPDEFEEIVNCLHVIKGNSGTLGANLVFLSSQNAEKSARSRNWTEFQSDFQVLQKELESFRKYLNEASIFEV